MVQHRVLPCVPAWERSKPQHLCAGPETCPGGLMTHCQVLPLRMQKYSHSLQRGHLTVWHSWWLPKLLIS